MPGEVVEHLPVAGRSLVGDSVKLTGLALLHRRQHRRGGVLLVQPGLLGARTAVVGTQPPERRPVLAEVFHPRAVEPPQPECADREVAGAQRAFHLQRRPQVGFVEWSRGGQRKTAEDDEPGFGFARDAHQLGGVCGREPRKAAPLPAVVEQRVLPAEGDVDHHLGLALLDD